MSAENMTHLTSADRDRIIRQVINNPCMSKTEIHIAAGITNPRSQRREDVILKPWIEKNTPLVFCEKIDCLHLELRSQQDTILKPNFVGKDSADRHVIVEIKFKFDFPRDKNHIRSDPEKKSIGQILKYAQAYTKSHPLQKPRLFIVSIDFSPDVSAVCKFLRSKGIDIEHIAIEKILAK